MAYLLKASYAFRRCYKVDTQDLSRRNVPELAVLNEWFGDSGRAFTVTCATQMNQQPIKVPQE